ncbi:hypothetical protein VTN00DRAFT_3647 [Thermoascus crustaceus]|uniref:uncharacterized protein n=1 Tax=Thermoascus crustaceus TaxID=5088 RepID=UPI003743F43C
MVTASPWLRSSRVPDVYKGYLMQNYVCARCAHRLRRSAASIANASSRSPASIPTGRRWSVFRRGFHNGSKSFSALQDIRGSPTPIDEILLRNEFEEKKDIREYLRKWQARQPNVMDPVRGPGTSNPSTDPSLPWVGNMLNDNREAHDAGSDTLRVTDEDTSEFSNLADEGEDINAFLEPGDLVALSSSHGSQSTAIYVRSVQKQQQFYTARGKWRIGFNKDLDYVIKGFAAPELVRPLHPYFPDSLAKVSSEMQSVIEGGVPRPIGAPLLRMMNEFDDKGREFYRQNSQRLDNIHSMVADDEERLEFTLRELAAKALDIPESELDEVKLFTVHQAAKRYPFLIDYDRTSVFTDHYLIQPKRVAKVIETVGNWVREHQEYSIRMAMDKDPGPGNFSSHPLQKFIQKAQRLIRLSRRVRSPTTMSNVGPTAQRFSPDETGDGMTYREVETEKFNRNDRMIIEYLQLFCIPPRRMTEGIMRLAGSHIMRATGMYSELGLSAASMPLFLQELGVFTPWENLRVLDQSLALPGHGTTSHSQTKLIEDVQQVGEQMKSEKLKDAMQDLRKDWGDLPIYCVDDKDAQEIDDGVSLERIPGSDDTFWIRIHVANPSAFLPLDHVIMKYAASRYSTLYVPERTYPMLPPSLTQAHFSLAPGRPTLTFSAKMNTKGEVLDTDITNGYARNVIYITHERLRKVFGAGMENSFVNLTVGGEFPEHSREGLREELSPEDENNFHILRKLMLAFREHRRKKGAIEWPAAIETPVSVFGGKHPMKPHNLSIQEGRYYLGDPVIRLQSRSFDPYEVPDLTKRNLISTLMNFACWIAGKWCADRNIPTVYDGTFYHPEYAKLTPQNISEYGGSNWLNLAAPKGISSSSVIPHHSLGLDAYVKSTSPLRRYVDLIAHYQIEAALRYEREHNRTLDADQETSVLPFTREKVDDYITRSRWQHTRLKQCEMASRQYWACLFLFRAFYFNECELPETVPCLLHNSYSNTALAGTEYGMGYIALALPFGVRCQLLLPTEMMDQVDILSLVEAKILSVDLSRMLVIMEGVRPIKHFERKGEWS